MKFNKWTVGLAAIGVVSLASAARADEKMSPVQTALSNTTISGYVSASFNWAMSPGGNSYQNSPAAGIPYQDQYGNSGGNDYLSKQDGFNLDVVKLSIAKPLDESPWASGYQVDLLFGPDSLGYNPSAWSGGGGGIAIKQAYIVLNTPVGNGINWKVGVFDSPIGYESFDASVDPNYTRSWGNAIEPTELTGVMASYKVIDELSLSVGIANTLMAGINTRAYTYGPHYNDNNKSKAWNKAFLGSVTFTAPSSWGWAAGSSLYAGIVYGFADGNSYVSGGASNGFHKSGDQINYYAGATFNTPCKQLTVGMAFDYANNFGGGGSWSSGNWEYNVLAAGVYATFKVTDKLSLNARGEYVYGEVDHDHNYDAGYVESNDGVELTGTVEYDLWANVISRLEVRWDHLSHNSGSVVSENNGGPSRGTSVGFYANVIYKF
jgi:hypothetical protein